MAAHKVGFILKPDQLKIHHQESFRVLVQLVQAIRKVDSSVKFFVEKSAGPLPDMKNVAVVDFERDLGRVRPNLLITIGGDGTLLRGARLLLSGDGWKYCRLAGVNRGRTGFLALLDSRVAPADVKRLLSTKGTRHFGSRTCLEVSILGKNKDKSVFHVLNDAVLTKGSMSRLFEFRVDLNEHLLSSYRADGLIVSTPTGSTAYNLAAGGATIEPGIPAFQLTPICPQSFSNKPIVVSDKNEIRLQLVKPSIDVFLTLDGHTAHKISPKSLVVIRKSAKTLQLFSSNDPSRSDYFQSLRQKLKWGLVPSTATC
jgi:NAD+ kinase